jgi:hypothetical protein
MAKKAGTKKKYIAVFLLVTLGIAVVALIYVTHFSSKTEATGLTVGVTVGDSFTYKLTGESVLISSGTTTPAYLSQYNATDYYQVTITGINGTLVTFDTVWKFTNGTAIQNSEWVNIGTGANSGDFWAIYPANLNVNNLINPKGNDGLIVNSTSTKTFVDSSRVINYWSISNVFTNPRDPTGSTQQYNWWGVYFDKQTGMLIDATNVQEYNNPQYNIIIIWQLTNSTVWGV